MTAVQAIAQQYDAMAAREADRLRTHPMERALTLDALVSHLDFSKAKPKLADIGGATGGYAFALAELGAEVHLRDLAPALVELAQAEDARRGGMLASVGVGSALDPDLFGAQHAGTFDGVLLLGPLYNLLERSERLRALELALREHPPVVREPQVALLLHALALLLVAARLRDDALLAEDVERRSHA